MKKIIFSIVILVAIGLNMSVTNVPSLKEYTLKQAMAGSLEDFIEQSEAAGATVTYIKAKDLIILSRNLGHTGIARAGFWDRVFKGIGYAIRPSDIYTNNSGSSASGGAGGLAAGYSPVTQDVNANLSGSGYTSSTYSNKILIGTDYLCEQVTFTSECDMAKERREVYF